MKGESVSEVANSGYITTRLDRGGQCAGIDDEVKVSYARDVEYVVDPGVFKIAVWDRFTPRFDDAHCVMYTVK